MVEVGPRAFGPHAFVLTAAAAQAFDAAAGGTAWCAGHAPPPMALVVGTLPGAMAPLVRALMGAYPPERRPYLMHRQERLVWHRRFAYDEPLLVRAALVRQETRRVGDFLHVQTDVTGAAQAPVATAYSTLFVRDPALVMPSGTLAPHPGGANRGIALPSWHVGPQAPAAYAAASFDFNPIHLDDAVARRAGLPGRILHGMCTLAFAARSIAAWAGPTRRLQSLTARFVRPVVPGDTLTCRLTPSGAAAGFVVVQQQGHVVVDHGQAQLGD